MCLLENPNMNKKHLHKASVEQPPAGIISFTGHAFTEPIGQPSVLLVSHLHIRHVKYTLLPIEIPTPRRNADDKWEFTGQIYYKRIDM